jgi:hypothetical protein
MRYLFPAALLTVVSALILPTTALAQSGTAGLSISPSGYVQVSGTRVDRLVFEKGGTTESFLAAFRINTREAVSRENLDAFLNSGKVDLRLRTDLIRRLSPDSLSIMEFKNEQDVSIAEKMLQFPLRGEQIPGSIGLTDINRTMKRNKVFDTDRVQAASCVGLSHSQ